MAMLTASSQLRASGRQGAGTADELIAFGQNTKWQEFVINYALQYAAKVKTDYLTFLTEFKNELKNKNRAA